MDRIRVLIADDHALVREGTRRILEREPGIEVVGEATDGVEAVTLTEEVHPDVAVLDIGMPELNGLEATRQIKERSPDVAVLILTVHDDDQYVLAVLEAGAAGYLLKDVPGTELVDAVRAIATGESVLDPSVTNTVLRRIRSGSDGDAPDGEAALSDREGEVLELLGGGLTNKQIAERLGVSPRTVQVHLGNVFRKLGVASRAEALVRGVQLGLVSIDADDADPGASD